MHHQDNSSSSSRPDPATLLFERLAIHPPSELKFQSYRLKTLEQTIAYFFKYILSGCSFRHMAFFVERLEGKNISFATLHNNFSKLEPILLDQIDSILKTRQKVPHRKLAQDSSILTKQNLKINVLYDVCDGTCISINVSRKSTSDSKSECDVGEEQHIIADAGYCFATTVNRHINQGNKIIYNCSIHNIALYKSDENTRLNEIDFENVIKNNDTIDIDVRCGLSDNKKAGKSKNGLQIFEHKLRLVGVKTSERYASRRLDKMKKAAQKNGYELRAVTIALSEWVFLITNLPRETHTVINLFNNYRARWAVERWFWRAKHILNFDKSRSKKESMKRIVLLGKILIALLWENERPQIKHDKDAPKVLSDHNFWFLCKTVWMEELQKGLPPCVGWGDSFNWLRYACASHPKSSTTMHLIRSGC